MLPKGRFCTMKIAHQSSILGMTTTSKLATGQRSPSISDRGAASPFEN